MSKIIPYVRIEYKKLQGQKMYKNYVGHIRNFYFSKKRSTVFWAGLFYAYY